LIKKENFQCAILIIIPTHKQSKNSLSILGTVAAVSGIRLKRNLWKIGKTLRAKMLGHIPTTAAASDQKGIL
jgi:hypothetical protein